MRQVGRSETRPKATIPYTPKWAQALCWRPLAHHRLAVEVLSLPIPLFSAPLFRGAKNSVALPFFGKKTPPATPDRAAPGGGDVPKAPQPAPTELSSLDFSRGDANRALAQFAGMVEVQEVETGIGAVFEEAAVLYANGADAEAEKVLVAVLDEPGSVTGEGLWMMLLDLYRLTGQRQKFESRVLDYATRFERSPPPWYDLSAGERRRSDSVPLVTLSGALNAQSAAQFQQIGIIGRKSGAVRIDLARVRGADDAGCALLRQVFAQLAADRVKVSLLNGGGLADTLSAQIEAGRAEQRDTWLLVLELLQYTADCERFEQLAIDYAVTFEESPPSWEKKASAAAAAPVAEPSAPLVGAKGEFVLDGELGGASNDILRKLAAHAAERKSVVVECSRLRRIDFVCAGTLFNIIATLQAQGRVVELRGVNAMVGALLRVMSVDQVAQVTLRA
ncbi:hypothetical protein dqs_0433 [Azoarcus olearius]|nr:hypothetical protein dqs_0433 [Azoarcus olearius]